MVVNLVAFVLCSAFIFLSVAFTTLFERKALSYSQRRKGPNKVGLKGLPQPISDAVKLFTKEYFVPSKAGVVNFYLGPFFLLVLSLALWWPCPLMGKGFYMEFFFIYFFCVSSLVSITIFYMGWVSNSKYSVFGAIRAIAQMVSYEVLMVMLVLGPVYYMKSLSCDYFFGFGVWFFVMVFLYFLIWCFTCLAELNRSPFDFVEGESELVSGFNVEYGGLGFTFIFLGEYMNIVFMGVMSSLLFLGLHMEKLFGLSIIFGILLSCLFIFFVIQSRASFPRFRYDLLMNLTWKKFLPLCLGLMLVIFVSM